VTRFNTCVKLAGVVLYEHRYSNDRTIVNDWRKYKALHAEGKGYDPGPRPPHYAEDYEDAKKSVMIEFAEHLKDVLSRPNPMARY
jgi:hypothetical protein